jgi:hypothetical protein
MREWLTDAIAGATSFFDIYEELRKNAPERREEEIRSLVWAYGYDFVSPDDAERREREGSPFGAMFEFDGRRMPPRLGDVPVEEVEIWQLAFEGVEDDRVGARLGDLLWERKVAPRPDLKARSAARSLMALAALADWEPMESTDALIRALELARSVADQDLICEVAEQCAAVIRTETADLAQDRPGIPLTLLGGLMAVPDILGKELLEELIGLCEERYGEDPFHMQTAIEMRVELTGADGERALRERQVSVWRQRASKGDGILRATFLGTALDLARTHGLGREADEIRTEIAGISEDDLDLKRISAEVKVPAGEIDAFIDAFLKPEDWRTSLASFGLHGPPGGPPEEVDQKVRESIAAHPLQFLVRNVIIDPDLGTPLFEADDDEATRRYATSQHRTLATQIWATFAVDILRRFESRYGRPSREELTEYFTTSLIEAAVAERIATSLELFWEGEFDQSAHLLAPRLETIVREMARRTPIPIIREPQDGKPGRVRGLGELLIALRGRLGEEGWDVYFYFLLSDALGVNLRNVIAHGLRAQVGPEEAALLIHAACYLKLLEMSTQPLSPSSNLSPDRDDVG